MLEDRWAISHLVQHQGRAFISVETGELVIARFTPAGYEEVDRNAPADAHPAPGAAAPTAGETSTAPSCGRFRRSRTATSSRATTPRSSACR